LEPHELVQSIDVAAHVHEFRDETFVGLGKNQLLDFFQLYAERFDHWLQISFSADYSSRFALTSAP
jgi:hypothetical protein